MYIIRTPKDRQRAVQHIYDMPMEPVQSIEIKEYKRNRTLEQNNALWGWCKIIGDYTGDSKEDVKDRIVLKCFGPVYKNIKYRDSEGKLQTITLVRPRETRNMKDTELTTLLNATAVIANILNVRLPELDQ